MSWVCSSFCFPLCCSAGTAFWTCKRTGNVLCVAGGPDSEHHNRHRDVRVHIHPHEQFQLKEHNVQQRLREDRRLHAAAPAGSRGVSPPQLVLMSTLAALRTGHPTSSGGGGARTAMAQSVLTLTHEPGTSTAALGYYLLFFARATGGLKVINQETGVFDAVKMLWTWFLCDVIFRAFTFVSTIKL